MLWLSVFTGGFATIVAALMQTENRSNGIVVGLIQVSLMWLVVGWVWAVYMSYQTYKLSN